MVGKVAPNVCAQAQQLLTICAVCFYSDLDTNAVTNTPITDSHIPGQDIKLIIKCSQSAQMYVLD